MDQLEIIKSKFEASGYSAEIAERTSQSLLPDDEIASQSRRTLKVNIPEERKFKTIFIADTENLEEIQEHKLEKFRFIRGYKGIWSKDLSIIECELEYDAETTYFFDEDYGVLSHLIDFKLSTFEELRQQIKRKILEFPSPKKGVKIQIGDCSEQFAVMERLQRKHYNRIRNRLFTIRIEGVTPNNHEEAIQKLIKLANTVFFQFDLVTHMPVRLAQEFKPNLYNIPNHVTLFEEVKFANPKFEYDEEPLALYMYARSSSEMPLLQYLAFYQVLEFYFPVFSLNEARSKIKNFIKNPLFDVNKDSDIAHIVNLIKTSGKGKSIGDERSQIKATIQGIVDQKSLLDFFNKYSERKSFFDQQKKNKGIAKQKINFSVDNDIRIDTALRIYEIRCRVVHSRDDETFELLLPYSKESMEMDLDLQLIEFLAQKAVIAASRPLTI